MTTEGQFESIAQEENTMRLIPVDTETSYPARLRCCVCGQWRNSGELYADLDGKPFKSYYCRTDNVEFVYAGTKVGWQTNTACANVYIERYGAEVITREAL